MANDTRWNSTFDMLQRAVEERNNVDSFIHCCKVEMVEITFNH